jgi:hypothetical protein
MIFRGDDDPEHGRILSLGRENAAYGEGLHLSGRPPLNMI